jgi:single-stranded-DNA-specific exonuclease
MTSSAGASSLREEAGAHPVILDVYAARLGDRNRAVAFLKAPLSSIPDPSELPGMGPAADRVEAAIAAKEHVGVFGHDDADGITSAAVMMETLRSLGARVSTYIPDREQEGHGLYPELIHHFIDLGVTLLVTTDGGSSNHAEAELAELLGMDVLVTDHHEVAEGRATPTRVLNPKTDPATAESHGDLTGAGVAALLARELLARAGRSEQEFLRLLDLVALGTVGDYGDVGRSNRTLTVQGLQRVGRGDRPAVDAVRCELGLKTADLLGSEHLRRLAAVFASVPSVRGESRGLRALIGADGWANDARALVRELRRIEEVDRRAAAQAERTAEETDVLRGAPAIVELADVPLRSLGGAASRLVTLTLRPAAVFTRDGRQIACELRAPEGAHLVEILGSMRDLLTSWGGHRSAAGFSADASRTPELRERLATAFLGFVPASSPAPAVDGTIAASDLDSSFVQSVWAAAPYGKGNPAPVLRCPGLDALGRSDESAQIAPEGFPVGPAPGDPLVSCHPHGERQLAARFRGWVE